jgi:RNA polymerase sigma-70 factor, ECF subfamily
MESEDIRTHSDEHLLGLSLERPSVFAELVLRYESAFVRKAHSILKSREDAEDIVQEAFTKIYLNAHRFEDVHGASFKSWAYKILINTALTQYQRNKRRFGKVATLDPEFYEMLPDTESKSFESEEIADYVVSILVRMPDNMRRILSMYLLEGVPQQEIAEREEMNVGAVKTRIHRAKKEFRNIATKLEVL